MDITTLTEVTDLRSAWKNEANDFTPWLARNISVLGEAIGLEMAVEETESDVGDFSADIYATEVGTDNKIIIENQLEDTNHDHLGKLLTYASGKDAKYIIWVVRHAREEHRSAIEWLNSHIGDNIGFFICEIKLYKIGSSPTAVKFDVIERPNDWTNEIKRNQFERPLLKARYEYWCAFNDYAFSLKNSKSKEFAKEFHKRKPSTDNWMSLYIGMSEAHLSITQVAIRKSVGVEIYIPEDMNLFYEWAKQKVDIEKEIGLKLDWQELPGKKASRIIIEIPAELGNKDKWREQFEWIMDTCIKFKRAFKNHLS